MGKQNLKYSLITVATLVVFLVIWEALASRDLLVGRYTPSPLEVYDAFIFKLGSIGPDGALLSTNIIASLKISLLGFSLAVIIGVPLGLLMGWYRLFDRFIRPLFELVRPIPAVSWIPLMIVWIGVGLRAKATIIFMSSFIPCVLNSYTGIRQTNKALVNVAKTYGASNFYTFLHVRGPSSIPLIFAGMRVALSNSWGTLVAAEMLASTKGLGYMIQQARGIYRPDIIICGMIGIGAIGAVFSWILSLIENTIVKGVRRDG